MTGPSKCTFGSCFDLSRCPISSGFPVYFYNNLYGWTSTKDGYGYLTNNPDEACLFVVSYHPESKLNLQDLPYWKGDGRNHVLIDTSLEANVKQSRNNTNPGLGNLSKAMIVSANYFEKNPLRFGFDVLAPNFRYSEKPSDLWSKLPSLLPLRRKYLISYQEPDLSENKAIKDLIEEPLNLINDDKTSDKVVIDFHCKPSMENSKLCGTFESRKQLLLKSNFALILGSKTSHVLDRISESLESGSIPVFLCLPDCQDFKRLYLPFNEFIDYSKFSIFLPVARISEAHFILRSFPDTDLFEMKRHGRLIWQSYLGSGPAIMSTVLNLIRTRAGCPAAPVTDEPSIEIFDEAFKPLHMDSLPVDMDMEPLGPISEPPMASRYVYFKYTK